jgi:hypothetical protein
MKFSFWTQKYKYEDEIRTNHNDVVDKLIAYYQSTSKSFKLLNKEEELFEFSRGYKWMSVCGLGSEKLFFHTVLVKLSPTKEGYKIEWDIILNIFGLQAFSNAIIKECKTIPKMKNIAC